MQRCLFGLIAILLLAGPVIAGENAAVTVDELAKTSTSWNGSVLPAYPEGQPEVTILRIRIAPGTELPQHMHPIINAGVLLSGQLTVVTKKGETLHMKPGDPIVEVVNQWHYGRAEGDEPVDIIVFYAGVVDGKITIKK